MGLSIETFLATIKVVFILERPDEDEKKIPKMRIIKIYYSNIYNRAFKRRKKLRRFGRLELLFFKVIFKIERPEEERRKGDSEDENN